MILLFVRRMYMNVLIIGDKHLPFIHKHYLDFCVDTRKKFKCEKVVDIGDHADFHAISQHSHDPDGLSPANELKRTLTEAHTWYKAFPKVKLCIGNHDERVQRAGLKYGLCDKMLKPYRKLLQLPTGWQYRLDYHIQGVRYFHGMGYSGKYAHGMAAVENGGPCCMGHLHSNAGTIWSANEDGRAFGLAVGCGIDRHAYAFKYGRDMRRKPMLGCGVVTNDGQEAQFVPMKL
jgi:hypothetical protein